MLDIRLPIGFLFSLLGLILFIEGLVTSGNVEMYRKSLGINVNLWCGLGMLVFGGLMLFYAWRGIKSKPDKEEIRP
jgi:hypothetical protein